MKRKRRKLDAKRALKAMMTKTTMMTTTTMTSRNASSRARFSVWTRTPSESVVQSKTLFSYRVTPTKLWLPTRRVLSNNL